MLGRTLRVAATSGIAIAFVLACAPGGGTRGAADTATRATTEAPRVSPKTATIALIFEPGVLEPSLLAVSREIAPVASAFLTQMTPTQESKPLLAAELPSQERGTWTVLPDGRMETTYKLRTNAKWHDGQPVTAHDFVFASQARLDPAFPAQRLGIERRLQKATALDDYTVFLEWREPYRMAGMIVPPDFAPMHRQLLEPLYLENKAGFVDGPQWRERFVGSGPYRVDRWDAGVEIAFRAHDGFVAGKPAIDQLIVKLIPDSNTIVANLLSGTVDVAFAESIGFPQGMALEQAAWDGRVAYRARAPRILEFQTRDWGNTQKAVFDVRVRRAALHGVDRAGIVDNIYAGKGRVAYFWMPPSDPSFPAADRVVRKYEFDPTRAMALLQEAGWVRSRDPIARNPAGDPLDIPMQNQPNDFDQQEGLAVANNWKAVGINSEVHRLSPQETRDAELRSTFAGVSYGRRAFTLDDMVWTSAQVPRPENRWTGQNRPGYVNPTLEDLWKKALGTLDSKEREDLLIQALQVMMEDAVVTLTHQQPSVIAHNATVIGPEMPDDGVAVGPLWNIWEWR